MGKPGKGGKNNARSKSAIAREKRAQIWKQPVEAKPDFDIMEEWQTSYEKLTDDRVGRWRTITETRIDPPKNSFIKRAHLLVRNQAKWDLYFYVDKERFDYTTMYKRLQKHPMVNNVEYLPFKDEGQWKENKGA